MLQNEVDKIHQALEDVIDPSEIYAALPNETLNFQAITLTRPSDQPSYLGLARINWDHFGADVQMAYNAGHIMALQQAARGQDPRNLITAYSMNAFADHFLEDSFSGGHTRTSRCQLHSASGDTYLCAKVSGSVSGDCSP